MVRYLMTNKPLTKSGKLRKGARTKIFKSKKSLVKAEIRREGRGLNTYSYRLVSTKRRKKRR